MKTLIKTFIIGIGVMIIVSFTNAPTHDFIGSYGVSANDRNLIQLTLNENRTFTYKDFSNPDKRIDVIGNWELKGNIVVLKEINSSPYKFHNKWSFTKKENGCTVANSRKGMTFYTLRKL